MLFVEPQIDWGQYGGMPGCSIAHLMIELVTFVAYNLDSRKKQGVLLTAIDYSKAFNRQDHNNFITILFKMNVPGWLFNIIMGFLTKRKMVLTHNGGTSDLLDIPP